MQNEMIGKHNTTYGKMDKSRDKAFPNAFWTELQFKHLAYICSEWLFSKQYVFKDNLGLN